MYPSSGEASSDKSSAEKELANVIRKGVKDLMKNFEATPPSKSSASGGASGGSAGKRPPPSPEVLAKAVPGIVKKVTAEPMHVPVQPKPVPVQPKPVPVVPESILGAAKPGSPVAEKPWKEKEAQKAAEERERLAKQKEERDASIQALMDELQSAAIFGLPGGTHLFRNTSAPVGPQVVLGNGCFRHKADCSPAAAVITHVFSGNAKEILFRYTRDPGTLPYTVVSATMDSDNTQGQSPTWSYAFPKPALTVVPADQIALYLATLPAAGGTVLAKVRQNYPAATDAESVSKCLGALFTLQTDTGALPGGLVAFVSNQDSQEHILLGHIAFTPGQDFFRSVSPDPTHPYRNRWKVLSKYPEYHRLVDARRLPD